MLSHYHTFRLTTYISPTYGVIAGVIAGDSKWRLLSPAITCYHT